MNQHSENYNKIIQLLDTNKPVNFQLGLRLLFAESDPELFLEFLNSKSYLSYILAYESVEFFQQNNEIWKAVSKRIDNSKGDIIRKFLPHKILHIEENSISAFVEIINKEIKAFSNDFPLFDFNEIITERNSFSIDTVLRGEKIAEGIGWSSFFATKDVGPPEYILEEKWQATAFFRNFKLIFNYENNISDIPKVWVEKVDL